MPQGVSYVHHANLYIRNLIPDDMNIPSSASLAYRDGALLNFALTEFSEVGLMGALSSHCAKPDLAIWAHQARQMSGQVLEAYRRG